jgi:single-stranded DNA-binding protein
MSNNYTAVVTLVQDPEGLTLKDKPATKIRFAVKATSKKNNDRFVNMLNTGYDAETAGRLAKGDQILITGPLEQEEYFSKKTKQKVLADVMGFGSRILKVIKSPSFFGDSKPPADDGPPPDDATPATGKGPLDDLDL